MEADEDGHEDHTYNIDIEFALLGSILVSERAMEVASALLQAEHFYDPLHQRIFAAADVLWSSGAAATPLTVKAALEGDAGLIEVGGQAYLTSLAKSAPPGGNVKDYARVISELAMRRELARVGEDILTATADPSVSPTDQIAEAERALYRVADKRLHSGGLVPFSHTIDQALLNIERASKGETGLPTGFHELDNILGGFYPSDLIIVAGRPGSGKTALATNIGFNTAKGTCPVGIFSIEMSGAQLSTRIISEQTGIEMWKLRKGLLTDAEWDLMTKTASVLKAMPLYIDDSGSISIAQIAARARRLKREKKIGIVIVDYLQLIQASGRRKENRVQEVTEITTGLKALAKELSVPVIALSQLSRGVDSRDDKRPVLSDLRESGCLSSKSSLLIGPSCVQYNTASHMSIGVLSRDGRVVEAQSKNLERRDAEVICFRLRSGRFVDCTPEHPILTDRGWVAASAITPDHAVACAAVLPEPTKAVRVPHARWMGWMLGNGGMNGYSSPSFICSDKAVADGFIQSTESLFGLTPRVHRHKSPKVWQYDVTAGPVRTALGNPCKDWLRDHKMWGATAPDKKIPEWFIETADNISIAELIGGLIDTDGSVPVFSGRVGSTVKFASTSRVMAWQVMWGLLRLGIFARIDDGYMSPIAKHPCYTVQICDGPSLRRFQEVISLTGAKGKKLASVKVDGVSNHRNRLGEWVGSRLVELARERGYTQSGLGYRDQGKRISQDDLRHFISRIGGKTELDWLTSPDIHWDRLRDITTLGPAPVFDRQVADDGHNFIANGIIVHNSIEQDADVVMFVYRAEYYLKSREPEPGTPEHSKWMEKMESVHGKGDIMVEKHRHGATGKAMLGFEEKFTRFFNLPV